MSDMQLRDLAREELLQSEIGKLVKKKWRIVNQTRFAAQLERRQWTCSQTLIAVGLLLCFIIPGIIYIAIIGQGKTYSMYLEVTNDLKVKRRKN